MHTNKILQAILHRIRTDYTQQNSTCKVEVLKNEKCMLNSRDCICSNLYLTNHLLNFALIRKTDNISIIIRRMTTVTEKRARAIVMLQQGAGRRKVNHLNVYKFRSPADKCRSLRQNKLNSSFSGRKSFRTPVFNDRGLMQTDIVSDTYCCHRPTALALSAVVIRRMMVETLSSVLFSETFSK